MAEKKQNRKPGAKPDAASLGGILLAVGGIVGGLILEKGELRDIAQYTAALIVLGGTFGATLISTPLPVFLGAMKRLAGVFIDKERPPDQLIEEMIGYATKARKNGLVSLETEADQISDPFLRKALTLAVDGTDIDAIRSMLELDIAVHETRVEAEAKVFESAGGFAPTIGIIGAVMGLIQVMKHLEDTAEVGRGIAVAFVATIYGVALANVFLLPAAAKIKARLQHETHKKEIVMEGVSGIVEGLNPKLIRSKLDAYLEAAGPKGKGKAKVPSEAAGATAPAAAGN
jgi:chemotaxis protein MotA